MQQDHPQAVEVSAPVRVRLIRTVPARSRPACHGRDQAPTTQRRLARTAACSRSKTRTVPSGSKIRLLGDRYASTTPRSWTRRSIWASSAARSAISCAVRGSRFPARCPPPGGASSWHELLDQEAVTALFKFLHQFGQDVQSGEPAQHRGLMAQEVARVPSLRVGPNVGPGLLDDDVEPGLPIIPDVHAALVRVTDRGRDTYRPWRRTGLTSSEEPLPSARAAVAAPKGNSVHGGGWKTPRRWSSIGLVSGSRMRSSRYLPSLVRIRYPSSKAPNRQCTRAAPGRMAHPTGWPGRPCRG